MIKKESVRSKDKKQNKTRGEEENKTLKVNLMFSNSAACGKTERDEGRKHNHK